VNTKTKNKIWDNYSNKKKRIKREKAKTNYG